MTNEIDDEQNIKFGLASVSQISNCYQKLSYDVGFVAEIVAEVCGSVRPTTQGLEAGYFRSTNQVLLQHSIGERASLANLKLT